jgi:hypothetical protein
MRLISRLILPLFIALPPCASAQMTLCSLGDGGEYDPSLDQEGTDYAFNIAGKVANALCGGHCNVQLKQNRNVGNALTIALPTGQARVVYNPDFLWDVEKKIGRGAVFGIFAHEVGHVADTRQNVSWMLDSWSKELRADAWAGCALARGGLSTDEMRLALLAISKYPSESHPDWSLRIPALEAGYSACGGAGRLPRR